MESNDSFLGVEVNSGRVEVEGKNNTIVMFRNDGVVQVLGANNVCRVIDEANSSGCVVMMSGKRNNGWKEWGEDDGDKGGKEGRKGGKDEDEEEERMVGSERERSQSKDPRTEPGTSAPGSTAVEEGSSANMSEVEVRSNTELRILPPHIIGQIPLRRNSSGSTISSFHIAPAGNSDSDAGGYFTSSEEGEEEDDEDDENRRERIEDIQLNISEDMPVQGAIPPEEDDQPEEELGWDEEIIDGQVVQNLNIIANPEQAAQGLHINNVPVVVETKYINVCLDYPPPGPRDPNPDHCPICHEILDRWLSDAARVDCNHWYHFNCICLWLERNQMCPLCKSPVWNVYKVRAEDELELEDEEEPEMFTREMQE